MNKYLQQKAWLNCLKGIQSYKIFAQTTDSSRHKKLISLFVYIVQDNSTMHRSLIEIPHETTKNDPTQYQTVITCISCSNAEYFVLHVCHISWFYEIVCLLVAFLGMFVGCLSSQQHASVPQRRISSDSCMCCHTEKSWRSTFYLI